MGYRVRASTTLQIPITQEMMAGLIRIANESDKRNPLAGGWTVDDVAYVRLCKAIAQEVYDIDNKTGMYATKYDPLTPSEAKRE